MPDRLTHRPERNLRAGIAGAGQESREPAVSFLIESEQERLRLTEFSNDNVLLGEVGRYGISGADQREIGADRRARRLVVLEMPFAEVFEKCRQGIEDLVLR